MIRVNRQAVDAPSALTGDASRGAIERRTNARHASANAFEKMSFEAFRDPSVREALNKLFRRKCAYCEGSLLGNQSGDIEHFRPKGQIWIFDAATGKAVKLVPGYYWLAAEWNNLLLSCLDCNRRREQEVAEQDFEVVGKGNWFPLSDELSRATEQSDYLTEPRLLLDPCVDDPTLHLEFDEEGQIEPARRPNGVSEAGQATIRICALDRLELVKARLAHLRGINAALRGYLGNLSRGEPPNVNDLNDLNFYMSPESTFSYFGHSYIRKRLGPVFDQLRAIGLLA